MEHTTPLKSTDIEGLLANFIYRGYGSSETADILGTAGYSGRQPVPFLALKIGGIFLAKGHGSLLCILFKVVAEVRRLRKTELKSDFFYRYSGIP